MVPSALLRDTASREKSVARLVDQIDFAISWSYHDSTICHSASFAESE